MEETDSEASRLKVAFVYYRSFSSFIKNDYTILSRHFEVREVKISSIFDLIVLAKAIKWCDLSFTWFAGEHAFPAVILSKALGKKSLVMAGGYDVASDKEIGYGQFTLSWHKCAMTKFVLEQADAVLAVSDFTLKEVQKRAKPSNLRLVYNGVDATKFNPGLVHKENLILTVVVISQETIKLKGIEDFVRSAELVTEAGFVIVGKDIDGSINRLKSLASENVEFTGRVSEEELLTLYRRAKVYVQVSAYESFGMALAEAMLCGCVPVVTDRGALPELVGDTGFYVPFGDEKKLGYWIKKALVSDQGSRARARIERMFSLKRREEEILRIVEEMLEG
ncbi:D-inositol-3-phosphate glycosyltransferase [uncultured archaeon]|nr:D-inositol-3-phosphate glycosyltransferase [uncultured archaeon]